MNELDTLRRAQSYMEQLAQGIDPVTGREAPEDGVLNNPRLIRCFFYVSKILAEDTARMERGERPRRPRQAAFYMTEEEKGRVAISEEPVTVSVLAQAVNAAAGGGEARKKLPVTAITAWLVEKGFLKEIETAPGKRKKVCTPLAASVGILEEERQGQYGVYTSILYTADAQRFLLDNLEDIIALREERRG